MHNCNFHKFEKNKYFYGKLMTVRDFEAEQQYFDGKRYLINRLLHGTGIVCGFENVKLIKKEGEPLKINFIDGGMALTCCGHEIVVPSNTQKQIIDGKGEPVSYLTNFPYLYLKYKSYDSGYIAVASNSSSCEEKCCPGRVIDDFEVVASSNPPNSGIGCKDKLSISEWLRNLEEKHKACPQCEEYQADMVFLGNVDNSDNPVKQNEPERYRILFRQKELYQILKCHAQDFESHVHNFESHLKNVGNPHKVTADQIGAPISISSVSNPGGNIQLVEKDSIKIEPQDAYNRIIIGETHSERTDNPHNVTAAQVEALVSVGGVSNSGGNIDLIQDGSIVITPGDRAITIGEAHSSRTDNPHKVSAAQVEALVSVGGVSNPGGNIDLIEGTNIQITPGTNSIKIGCTLGLVVQPAEAEPKSIGLENLVGTSTMYAREDHVHKMEDNSVDYSKLSAGLQEQLSILSMYLRERALKCSVTSFKKVAEDFKNDRAFEISLSFKKAIGKKLYEKENDFINFINSMQNPIKVFAEEIRELAEEGCFDDFADSLEVLQKMIGEGIPLKVAAQQDEVCFYALELKLTVNNPMYRALNCTAVNFRKVADLFKSEIASKISFSFEKAVDNRVYEDGDKFVEFMVEHLKLLNKLQEEITLTTTEDSLNNYASSIKDLADAIESRNALKIADRLQEVCSHAQNLAINDDPVKSPMYRALKCAVGIYREVSRKLESDIADTISLEFERAVNKRLYEKENDFIEFMEGSIDLLLNLPEEIKDAVLEKELNNYIAVANELADAIKSRNALKIAEKQEELCFFAKKLDPANYMYRSLKCTVVNFAEAADLFENRTAKSISVNFGKAIDNKLYEDDSDFMKFIGENLESFRIFGKEIKELATKETLNNYMLSVNKLADIIKSREALKIAAGQQEICSSARELDIHLVA
jgi:hypothetical protein